MGIFGDRGLAGFRRHHRRWHRAAGKVLALCGLVAALTRSEKGSVVVDHDRVIEVPAHPVDELVDTTGAGDLYASGFLYGFSQGLDLATCGALGSLAAAEVISHLGARPAANLRELAQPLLGR